MVRQVPRDLEERRRQCKGPRLLVARVIELRPLDPQMRRGHRVVGVQDRIRCEPDNASGKLLVLTGGDDVDDRVRQAPGLSAFLRSRCRGPTEQLEECILVRGNAARKRV